MCSLNREDLALLVPVAPPAGRTLRGVGAATPAPRSNHQVKDDGDGQR